MGNLCCSTDGKSKLSSSPFVSKKKRTLKDEITKTHYEAEITRNYNSVLCEFSREKFCPKRLRIKSLIGKGGQGSVFLIELHEDYQHKANGA